MNIINNISIVIITKNEGRIIEKTLSQAKKLSDDIIVVDSGSVDNTVEIAKRFGTNVIEKPWEGYGVNKNFGAQEAKYDWILSLDADEVPNDIFINSVLQMELNPCNIYQFKINTYFSGKKIRNEVFSPMWRYRLYYKYDHQWSDHLVHEKLTNIKTKLTKRVKGDILHYSYENEQHQILKLENYALSQAKQWQTNQYKPTPIWVFCSAVSRFLKHYFLHFGFLYGREGYIHAKNEYSMVIKKLKFYKNLIG
ncbi:MAG TPA: glycosyltransferase family 2 protein [Saprospiraceae bacterium]|nr:glycosyltransferase family 2 protein [Saprospiraceae bacterium]